MFKIRYLSCIMMLSFLMPPVFADEMTANTEKNPPTATSSAKSAEKHEATNTSDDAMDVTALEGLELDDEAKAMALEVQKLQLEVQKLELLHKKSLMDMQAAREKLTLENDMQQAEETKLQAKLTTAKARLELENTPYRAAEANSCATQC